MLNVWERKKETMNKKSQIIQTAVNYRSKPSINVTRVTSIRISLSYFDSRRITANAKHAHGNEKTKYSTGQLSTCNVCNFFTTVRISII